MLAVTNESDFEFSSEVVAVKFWAAWCGPCKRMNPLVEKMEQEFGNVKFLSVDVDQVPSLAQKFKVRMLPTLLLLKKGDDGSIRELNRVTGMVLTEPLRKVFRDATKSLE